MSTPPRPRPGRTALRRAHRALRAAGVTVATVALTAVIAALVGGYLAGWHLYVVQSGSMGRAAPVGSIVAARPLPAAELRVGQVVLLTRPNGVRVLHRVVDRTVTGEQVMVRTKGDVNPVADPGLFPVPPTTLTPAFVVPEAGYAAAALASTPVRALLLTLAGLLVLRSALRRRSPPPAMVATGNGA